MSVPATDNLDSDILRSVVEHVFMPPKLPQVGPDNDTERKTNVALCDGLIESAQDFLKMLPPSESPLWIHMIKMMELARRAANAPLKEGDLQRMFSDMPLGSVFCMHIRAQNAALIVRRLATADFVLFEVFEVLPLISAVMKVKGKLLCSYPGPAIQVPADIFTDKWFLQELSSFLVQMDVDGLDSTPITPKKNSTAHESAHPRYISELLVGILRGCGRPAVVDRITKRIGDIVLSVTPYRKPWRRSPLWLILRVALQSSLRSNNLYKPFVLFFHAHLLRCGVRQDFPSELLYVMRAKTAWRLSKLGSDVSHHVHQFVHDSAREAEALLSERWTAFQEIESTHSKLQLKGLDFVADSNIFLVKSYSYLADALLSTSRGFKHRHFTPSYRSRLYDEHDFAQFANGRLEYAIAEDPHIAVADFELSVETHLKNWVVASTNNDKSLDVIASCIEQYFSGAKDLYKDNPEDNSMMILTIVDLWVALDRLAIQACSLLKQYPPEIPSNFLHCLLLHRSAALKRALHIEEYLCQRHKEALGATSIFSGRFDDSCFGLKYFRTSENLQRLYDKICRHARREAAEKRAELDHLKEESILILCKASKMRHKYKQSKLRLKFGDKLHSASCKKCKLEHQAGALETRIHEYPIPHPTIPTQLVVFELSPPRAFSIWRDITYMILGDIGKPRQLAQSLNAPTSGDVLDSSHPLRRWAAEERENRRVTVRLVTRSLFNVAIPANESLIVVDDEPTSLFPLFDLKYQSWAMRSSSSRSSAAELCDPPMPTSSPYRHIHRFVCSTQYTPNYIIAVQATCPDEINLHEFISFSGLRSGPRLQWLNIARELASPYLSFSREEVHTLITQAAWQLGPLSDDIREWHADLSISSFGNVLLRELETLLEKTRANWQEEVTARTIALICSRLLASTTDVDISRRACSLLREARTVTYRWMGEIRMKIDSTSDKTLKTRLQGRLCMLAATCFSTFGVCPEHVPTTIVNEEDLSIAIQCAVIVHDNTPQVPSGDSSLYLARMLRRHHRLLHDLEPLFSQSSRAVRGLKRTSLLHGAFNHALERVWLGYRQGNSSGWHVLHEKNPRWISCVANEGQEVHYDLLTGELLIGGKSSGGLPKGIVEDPLYKSIFGARIFDVVSADIPGMEYMTRSTLFGYQILFSWNDGDIILQARKSGNSQLLQLIPRSKLIGDFPQHFVDEYIHWLDLSTGELEFRPIGSPWTPRPSNWCLYLQKLGVPEKPKPLTLSFYATLQKACQDSPPIRVIDIRSSTFGVVSRLLSPIENPGYLIITHTTQTLDVSLPRFRLSFFVNTDWELECRGMPSYVVDKTQSCGAMFGLRNKLILCPGSTSLNEPLMQRRAIIPQGQISFSASENFTKVYINTGVEGLVRWHEYTIDTDLGCLRGNTSLMSKLYQCYLHALTSHCLPDPLLGHTGTEEALYILRSAGCRSFQRLDAEEAKMLELIGDLTTCRDYSSENIAKVTWKDLPALSQHNDFFLAVRSLLDHARALETLYDKPTDFGTYHRPLLSNREAPRTRLYYPPDLHVSGQASFRGDVEYQSRDIPNLGDWPAEHAAFRTSWLTWNGRPSLDRRSSDLWDLMKSWGSLGPMTSSKISLRYSRYWLEFHPAREWFVIYELCCKAVNRDLEALRNLKTTLLFSLSAATYGRSKYSDIVPIVMIIALDERCHNLGPPLDGHDSYWLADGVSPELAHLKRLVSESALPISSTPAHSLRVEGTTDVQLGQEEYDAAISRESSVVAESILHQWPDHQFVDFPERWFIKSVCNESIKKYTLSITRNIQLRSHVRQLQDILQHYGNVVIPTVMPYVFSPQFITSTLKMPLCSLCDVLSARSNVPTPPAGRESLPPSVIPSTAASDRVSPPSGSNGLQTLIDELQNSQQSLLQLCGSELSHSHRALVGQNASQFARHTVPSYEVLIAYHHECSQMKDTIFSDIEAALSPSQKTEETISTAGLWPRITPRSILRQLARDRFTRLSDQWKAVIMRYALSLLKYQQSVRLLALSSRQKHEELIREIEAVCDDGVKEWTPDWLLIQIEGNFMARPVQVAVARKMISPSPERNISLQLNMGEGKSSVIVPLIASTLANGSNLVRIVTLKPLSSQMFQLFVNRLSGLVNRPIFHVPISRHLLVDTVLVRTIKGLFEDCVAKGGVLVIQPEHILSLKLLHIDTLLKSHGNSEGCSTVDELGALCDWLARESRDVLDESDEILHVRYQLIYTAGEQMPPDDHPNRWLTIQQVFGRLQKLAVGLHADLPMMLGIDTALRGFPIMHILDPAIFGRISSHIINDALAGGLPNLPLGTLPPPIREAARRLMARKEVSDVDHELVHRHCAGTTLFSGILLLRGLLMEGEGVLCYVLRERRWKVDYGLDPSRTLLAVPYRAKDVPSQRADFAHPDVAIALTCLSYYYGGLTKNQVLLCFDMLAKLDNPEMEYESWVELGQDPPVELRQLNGVNLEDETQVNELLVPFFSRNKGVVDFYLSQIVFPQAAREFPSKLPTSAWDLVEEKKNVTTGFSGTNDNRYLLPTSITQEDPDFVRGTNALVLQNLLRPENDHYECTEGDKGERESATTFLKRLVKQEPEIRVLLDVGAQMLELQNEELARQWLSLRPDVSAAIFFNDSDHLAVVTPDGTIEPFISSPFNRQLEKCIVYLDDARTRGTDLKLPRGMRAAVTLGPKVTKDRLVQGCMRMRQLGNGHSVMFFAPAEVDRCIRSLIPSGMAPGGRTRVLDVVRWAIYETCEDIGHRLPYWAQQGLDHRKRSAAYEEYRSSGDSEGLRSTWLQPESQTLEEMYWNTPVAKMGSEINGIPALCERIKWLGCTKLVNVRMAEEQEREVNHEVEPKYSTGRKHPRPPRVLPAEHIIHADIREFIETGKLPVSPTHIYPLLASINMVKALDFATEWPASPFATADFATTTLSSFGESLTEYLRPVNWILSSGSEKNGTVVVISPYEANALLPVIRKSNKVRLHTYAPRVTSSMCSFSDLTFYSIPNSPATPWSAPAHTRTLLNLLAGQLYFDSTKEYERACVLLALSMAHPGATYIDRNGFVPPNHRTGKDSPFARSMIPMLKKLIGLRRKGMDYSRTHLGQILNGKPLGDEALWDMSG